MILERTLSKNIGLSLIGCDSEEELNSKVYLVVFARFSNMMLFKPIKYFLEKRSISFQSFRSKESYMSNLFIIGYPNGNSVLDSIAQKGWISMCKRFSLVEIVLASVMRSLPGTHYAEPSKEICLLYTSPSPRDA